MNDLDHLRVPPQSIEAEQAVLGGLMLSPGSFDMVADLLQVHHFYRQDHQLIFQAIKDLAEKKKPFDAVTMGEWFESQGLSEQVAGGAYLIELATTTPSAANIKAYAEIVRDKALLRAMIDVGTGIVNDSFQPHGRDTAEILDRAERAVIALGKGGLIEIASGVDGLRHTAKELSRRFTLRPGDLLGVSTSLDGVDEMTMGLQDTDLIILAGRPSMGKTALLLQMMRCAAMNGHKPFGVEMEMNSVQVYMRHIAAVGRIDFAHVQRPARATEEERRAIKGAMTKLRGLEWWLDDSPSMTVDQITRKIRRMKVQHGIGIVFIDYLQYIDLSPHIHRGGTTASAVQEVTRTLKSLAKELGIPIVLLSQLNRALETRSDKRPMMADLRESGAIEQDADVVMFVHRQGYFEKDWPKDDPRHNVAEVILGKVRNGQVGSCPVQWMGRYQQFNNLSYEQLPGNWSDDPRKAHRGFEPRPAAILNPPSADED